MSAVYAEAQNYKNVLRDEEGKLTLDEDSHLVFLPHAKRQVPAVRIVATGMDRFMRYQLGFAVFSVVKNGKRETLVLPARQETGKESGNIIWSAQAKPMGFTEDIMNDVVDAMAEAVDVENPIHI